MSNTKTSTQRRRTISPEVAALAASLEDLLVEFPHAKLVKEGGLLRAAQFLNLRLAARDTFVVHEEVAHG